MPIHLAALLIPLVAAAAPQAGDAGAQPLGPLVRKVIAAYGGEAALKKVVAVREKGKVASTMRGGAQGSMVRTFARPERLRVEIGYPNEELEVRILDGAKGWRRGAPVQGPPLQAMVLQAARLALPLSLLEKEAQLKDLGLVEREGQTLRAIELPITEGMTLTAYVEPSTSRVVQTMGRLQGPAGPLVFSSTYGDFRKVKGVLVPFQERTTAMGQHTGDTALESVELLTSVPKEAFVP